MKRIKFKNILSLSLTTILIVGALSGCSSAKKTAEVTKLVIDTKTVDTYKVFLSGSAASGFNWSNPVAKEITKRTGVALQADLAISDPDTKISLMAASGQYDDIVLNTNASMQTMVKSKAYVNLSPLIDKYGSNIKKLYGNLYDRIKYTSSDPSIYGFGIGSGTISDYPPGQYWGVGFYLQNDMLKSQGYPKIKTPADFENALIAEIKANPKTANGKKRYGLSLPTSDGFRYGFSIVQPAAAVNGLPTQGDYYYDAKTKQISLAYTQQYFKDYIQWYNKMYNEGLIDPESFTQNYDTYLSKISQGQVAGLIDGFWEYSNAVTQLRKSNQGNLAYEPFTPLNDPANTKWMNDQPLDVAQQGAFSITTTAKHPEKIVNFFNFLASEEGQILTEWGIEGVNYTIVDGKRVQKPEDKAAQTKDGAAFALKTGVQLYARDYGEWLHQPYGYKTSNGQMLQDIDTTTADATFSQPEKDTLKQYGVKLFTDLFPKASSMPVVPVGNLGSLPVGNTDDTKVALKSIADLKLPNFAKCIMSKPADFDANWQSFMDQLKKAGSDKVVAELNASLTDRVKLWGTK